MRVLTVFTFALLLLFSTTSTALTPPLEEDEDAAECDCPDNYICEADVIEYCDASEPAMCPPDDEDCVEEPVEPECYEETFTRCVPPECDSDSDCGAGTICVEYVYESCSGGGGSCGGETPDIGTTDPDEGDSGNSGSGEDGSSPPPEENMAEGDEDCVVEESTDCELHTERYCVPPYLAPCDEDADCGDGFDCEFSTYNDAPSCAVSSDDDEDDMDCMVEEESSEGPGRCVLQRENCEVDADCDHDFVCHASDQPADAEPTDCMVEPDSDFEDENDSEPTDCAAPEPAPIEGYCAPEDFHASSGGTRSPADTDSSTGEYHEDSDQIEAEPPASSDADNDGELLDSFHVGEEDSDDDAQQDEAEAGTCATVGGSGSAPVLLVIALLAGAATVRRRH